MEIPHEWNFPTVWNFLFFGNSKEVEMRRRRRRRKWRKRRSCQSELQAQTGLKVSQTLVYIAPREGGDLKK